MPSEYIQIIRTQVLTGELSPYKFFDELKDAESADVIAICEWITSNLSIKEHPSMVKLAFTKLAKRRHLPSYDKFLSLKKDWINSYYNEYQFVEALFENARKGAQCNCSVYQVSRFNVPPYQEDLERVDEKHLDDVDFGVTHLVYVRCKDCGGIWEVGIDYMYHYPHSHWSKMRD
ncbi:MAG: hypothetical protein BAJATHORv1_90035 [Candidatus Thorarchaeota archaeon]|nr:MAG: hypothetical protein BAJATHORv1_90035 [Candidatus Thorarchaeota archaeon]